jgi:hypothetical protein
MGNPEKVKTVRGGKGRERQKGEREHAAWKKAREMQEARDAEGQNGEEERPVKWSAEREQGTSCLSPQTCSTAKDLR